MDQICPKTVFPLENRKNEHHHWIMHIEISLSTIFQLKLIILIFWTKLNPKGYFWLKIEKMNTTIKFCIFELVEVPDFSSNWQFWIFGPNLPKKGISHWKWKHHHLILHIRISLGTKFQFNLIIFNFRTKFAQKRYSRSKTEKSEHHH